MPKGFRKEQIAGALSLGFALVLSVLPVAYAIRLIGFNMLCVLGLFSLGLSAWCLRQYMAGSVHRYMLRDAGDSSNSAEAAVVYMPKLIKQVEDELDPVSAAHSLKLIFSPRKYFERISDRVESLTRSVDVRSTFAVRIPSAVSGEVMVPTLRRRRGSLHDGLSFYDSDGKSLTSCTRTEAVSFMLATIRGLVRHARGVKARGSYIADIEPQVHRVLYSNQPVPEVEIASLVSYFEPSGSCTESQRSSLKFCKDMLERLRLDEFIFVRVPPVGAAIHSAAVHREDPSDEVAQKKALGRSADRRIRIVANSRTVLRFNYHSNGQKHRDGIDFLRHLFGIRPAVLTYPLTNVGRTSSYHLQIAGPKNYYLGRQAVVSENRRAVSIPSSVSATPRLGQRHAHLYVSNGESSLSKSGYEVQFFERMPGSMAAATASAVSVAILVLMAAVVVMADDADTVMGSWEYVAILLAFPIGVTLWLGVESDNQIKKGALVARISALLTICIAVIAGLLSLLEVTRSLVPLWQSMAILAFVNSVIAGVYWVVRVRVEASFINASGRVI